MQRYFGALALSLVVASALTAVIRNVARRFGLLDQVSSSRKIHTTPVPRLGGIGILGGVAASLIAFGFLLGGPQSAYAAGVGGQTALLGCGVAMAALGIYDDLRGADAWVKFCAQFLVACAVYFSGLRITEIANPFGAAIPLGSLAFPVTLVWIVGVVNAVNLIDGLDGLAGGVALVAVATDLLLAARAGDPAMCLLLVALGGAVLGFLLFNFNPASIFMGDSGSMLIGFILAVVPLRLASRGGSEVPILVVSALGLGVPIVDTAMTMIRRGLSGRPIFSGDKEHIHHRVLRQAGGSQRKAVFILYAACVGFGAAGAVLAFLSGAAAAAWIAGVVALSLYLLHRLGCFRFAEDLRVLRERNRRLRDLGRELRRKLGGCRSSAEVVGALEPVADQLHCQLEVSLDGESVRLSFVHRPGASAASAGGFSWESGVMVSGRPVGKVRATWFDGRGEPDRDEERFLEALVVIVGSTISRERAYRTSRGAAALSASRGA